MLKIIAVSLAFIVAAACGETPGSGTNSTASPSGPSNANTFKDSAGDQQTDSSQITIMSGDSSQLNRSSDSALKNQRR